jgi:murein DD-endopeptidase MepM/ murein hydrolase activator NlpD
LIEIDHGNEFSSRYAHLSKLDVKVGQIVRRGARIGASGNTGRSTGPHLHFEVRYRGVAQNPARFLQQGGAMLFAAAGKAGAKEGAGHGGGKH